ncbi:hypothetical protein BDV18DRAFT_148193, partial [Aspergillus unguis]
MVCPISPTSSFTMMNNVVAPIRPSMVTYTVQAKRTTELFVSHTISLSCVVIFADFTRS